MSPSRELASSTPALRRRRADHDPQKAESRAIQTPLSIVAELYARQHSSSHAQDQQEDFFSAVSSHFSSVLSGHASQVRFRLTSERETRQACKLTAARPQIPRLEDTSAQGRLVRFRCMVQDTGLANEVYALDTGRAGAGADESGAGCCAYSEGAIGGSPVQDVSCTSLLLRLEAGN